jgi:hypothetical protein
MALAKRKSRRGAKRVTPKPHRPTEPELNAQAREHHAAERKTRPRVVYSYDLSEQICERLSNGETATAICQGKGMPTWGVLQGWIRDKPDFAKRYAKARGAGWEYWADNLIDIADTPCPGVISTLMEWGTQIKTADMLDHRRLRIETRKWLLAKRKPQTFGEKIEQTHTGPDGGPLQVEDRNTMIESIVRLVFPKADGKTKPDKDGGGERER